MPDESENIIEQLVFNAIVNDEPVLLLLPVRRNYDKYIVDPSRNDLFFCIKYLIIIIST